MNHNQIRFAQLTGNSQVEFQQAWDELVRYTTDKARGYFDDGVSLDEAVDEVMSGENDSVTSWLIKIKNKPEIVNTEKNAWGYLKKLIRNRLAKLSKTRDYYPSSLGLSSGDIDSDSEDSDDEITPSSYRAFTPVEKEVKTKDSIIFLYALGMTQTEIVRDLEVDKGYVSRIIKKSAKEIEELKAIKANFANGYKVD
uniref:Uncharacterized protein n=1 Tax=viral metagenome TaxID=1070528 RepID=A0A6M3JSJ1_9ZZZZ